MVLMILLLACVDMVKIQPMTTTRRYLPPLKMGNGKSTMKLVPKVTDAATTARNETKENRSSSPVPSQMDISQFRSRYSPGTDARLQLVCLALTL